ncbi:MAG TPA: hypothetical protein VGK67_34085 [Myxococcales bacterium]
MTKLLGIAALALSVVALGVSLTRGGGPPAPEGAASPPPVDRAARAEGGGQDDGRLSQLELEISRLMRRVDALERAGVTRPGEPATAMTTEQQAKQLQALRTEVDALLTGEPLGTEEGRKRLKDVVRAVQDEMFADRAQQREIQRDQERSDRLKKFIEEARLSSTQAQDLSKLLDDESAQRKAWSDARRAANGAGAGAAGEPVASGQQAREQMRTLRQTTDATAKAMLSAEQYTQYETMRSEDRGGGRGGGPGAGPGSHGGGSGNRRGP